MANILGNVFKGKDSMNGGLATQGAGQSSQNIRPANPNITNIQTSGRPGGQTAPRPSNSTAAQLQRERAAAAKAQIEMRKAAEAARKDDKDSNPSDKKDITPVGLNLRLRDLSQLLLTMHSMLLSRLKKKRLLQLKVSRSSVSPLMAELLLSLLWLLPSLSH